MGWSMNKFGNIFWQYVVSRRRLLYLVVIFLMVDLVFAFLFPETGKVFLYAILVLGFFSLCVLVWDFAMTFQDYRKALLYEEIDLASPLEHLLYEKYTEEQQAVHIRESRNPAREMEETALMIRRLMREEGYRCRDFAVITGDMETYADHAARAFDKFDIPCFIDQKKSVFMNPFVEFLRSAVDMLLENYSYESVFRLLRCGLLDLPCRDMDRLENYVLGMGIRGFRKWQEEWVLHYRGEKPEEVPEIDRIRQQLMDTLAPFTEQMKTRKGTVRERVLAFY